MVYPSPSFWPQPYMPQPYQPPQPAPIIKVNGRESAMQYQLPPNSMSQPLFDANGKMFYIVSTDGAGMKTIETFDFSPHVEEAPPAPSFETVSRREFDELVAKVRSMEVNDGIHGPIQPAGTDKPAGPKD